MHECEAMAWAIKEDYIEQKVTLNSKRNEITLIPALYGPKLPGSRKTKRSLLISYRPFCGMKIDEDRSKETEVE